MNNTAILIEYHRRKAENERAMALCFLALVAMFVAVFLGAAILNARWAIPTICQPHITHGGQYHCEAN